MVEGFRGLRRHPSLALGSSAVLAGVLFLAAVFVLGTVNLMVVVRDLQKKVDMVVLLEEEVRPEEARGLATIIGRLEGVEAARYVSAEEVLEELGTDSTDRRFLLELLGDQPFPASLQLQLGEVARTPERLEKLSLDIQAIPGVDAALYGKEWVEPLARVVRIVLFVDGLIGGVVGLICVVVAWGAGRLAVYGRREVLEVMRLTGARRWYLSSPFAVEGATCGMAGGTAAVGVLYLGYLALAPHIEGFRFMPTGVAAAIPLAGALLGALGSVAALKH